MANQTPSPVRIEYPSTDGKPMAEGDPQRASLTYAVDGLRRHFRDRDDVYVSGNLLIYYEEGNPRVSVAPDVFVVKGIPNHDRDTYLLWEEGKGPDFVLEITSRTTRRVDQGKKRTLYRTLEVREYWQYDPTGDYLRPPLQGLQLVAGDYLSMPVVELADGALTMRSGVLDLELRVTDGQLRFHDPETGRRIPSFAEAEEARERAEQERERAWRERHTAESRLAREAAARRTAEARVAELEAALRRQQGESTGPEYEGR